MCVCVYDLSPVVVYGSMSIVLFFSFLKIQLEWHLFLAPWLNQWPLLCSQCVHILMRASVSPAGMQVCTCPSPCRFWVLGDRSAEMLALCAWLLAELRRLYLPHLQGCRLVFAPIAKGL